MTNRKFKEIGIMPFFAYLLLTAIFVGLSTYLFNKTENAKYFYPLIPIVFLTKLSESNRTEFLKFTFGKLEFFKIRIAENVIFTIPFILFLLYKGFYIYGLISIIPAFLMVLTNMNTALTLTIPTPFSKEPFEFCIGFRSTFFMYFIAYGLTVMAMIVNNFNLGVFAMLLCFAVILMYYSKPEKEYFVWSFNRTPTEFLLMKIKTGIKFSAILVAPIFMALSIYNIHQLMLLTLFLIIGFGFVCYAVVAKYAYYPEQVQLVQAVFLMLSILFPPLLLILIPYLFAKSKTRLNYYLK